MATIQDVALRAGVSKSTVSKVLNGTGRISETTKKTVYKAVKDLNYRPNIIARSLSKQSTDTIGLIIPRGYNTSQYITKLIDMIQELANKSDKFLMISQVDGNDIENGIESIRKLVDRQCNGIIYYKSSQIEKSYVNDKLESLIDELPIPLVIINSHLPNKPEHCVWFDHTATSRLAADYLIQQGHKNIGYISGPYHLGTSRARLQGYQESLKNAGIELDPLFLAEAKSCNYQGGYDACKQLIDRNLNLSAICCFNDTLAIGAMKALKDSGLSVPDDVSIFGLDNDDIDGFITTPLSSIAMPVDEIISIAGQMLFQLMDNQPSTTLTHSLVGKLVHRESVKPLVG